MFHTSDVMDQAETIAKMRELKSIPSKFGWILLEYIL
jgi:hypothetical protein